MRWLLAILMLVSLVAYLQRPPAPDPAWGKQPTEGRKAVLWTFLATRRFDPAKWKLCIDTARWAPPFRHDKDLFTPDPGPLAFPPYSWTESHGMALLLMAPNEWRDQYPDWPARWLQFSPVGFSPDKKRALFTYFMVHRRDDTDKPLSPNNDILVELGYAELARQGRSVWNLVTFEERPVPPSIVQAKESELRVIHRSFSTPDSWK